MNTGFLTKANEWIPMQVFSCGFSILFLQDNPSSGIIHPQSLAVSIDLKYDIWIDIYKKRLVDPVITRSTQSKPIWKLKMQRTNAKDKLGK